jgi:hypothetical protein
MDCVTLRLKKINMKQSIFATMFLLSSFVFWQIKENKKQHPADLSVPLGSLKPKISM